jgi:hypothetical protein
MEWLELIRYCGGDEKAGNLLKSTKKWNGTGSVKGFNAIPSGYRSGDYGYFLVQGLYGNWWSSTPNGSAAWYCTLYSEDSIAYRGSAAFQNGFSVRLIKD